MFNMNFLIADVILFLSKANITFSQRDATKIKSKQFPEFGSQTTSTLSQNYGKILELIILSQCYHMTNKVDLTLDPCCIPLLKFTL